MTDEEKKEYEAFKYYYQTNTEKGISYIPDYMCENVLNLIEKQSKEIEELKEQGKEVVCVPEGTCFMIEPKNIDKKWEDKIKAKIEIRKEEKENCKDSIEEKYLLREIYVLQSLLKKE